MKEKKKLVKASVIPTGLVQKEQYALYFLLVARTGLRDQIEAAITTYYNAGNPSEPGSIANVDNSVKAALMNGSTGLGIANNTKLLVIFKLLRVLWINGNQLRPRLIDSTYGAYENRVSVQLQLNYGPPPCPVGGDLSSAWTNMTT